MAIFKTIDEIQEHVRIHNTVKLESLQPYENDMKRKYLKPFLESELLGLWETAYDEDDLSGELEALTEYIQRIGARFLVLMASGSLDIQVGETGFTTSGGGTNMVAASKDRVKRFKDSLEMLGWEAVESLLEFLEENESDYPEWTESDAYTKYTGLFINSSIDFNEYVTVDVTRLQFQKIIPIINNLETIDIIPKIDETYAAELKEQDKAGTLTEANEKIIKWVKRSIANLAVSKLFSGILSDVKYAEDYTENSLKRDEYKRTGDHYLNLAFRYMHENIDDYPTFADSDQYDDEEEDFHQFENNDDTTPGLFVAGGQ